MAAGESSRIYVGFMTDLRACLVEFESVSAREFEERRLGEEVAP